MRSPLHICSGRCIYAAAATFRQMPHICGGRRICAAASAYMMACCKPPSAPEGHGFRVDLGPPPRVMGQLSRSGPPLPTPYGMGPPPQGPVCQQGAEGPEHPESTNTRRNQQTLAPNHHRPTDPTGGGGANPSPSGGGAPDLDS